MNIDYQKLADKLDYILDYANGDRPEDICEELMIEYGQYYDVELFHGSTFEYTDIRKIYNGFVSCSSDINVARRFSEYHYENDGEECWDKGSIVKVRGFLFAVDIAKLIDDCYRNLPNNALAEYLYNGYYEEHEFLLYAEDVVSKMSVVDNKDISKYTIKQ